MNYPAFEFANLKESLAMAFAAVRTNKLRSILTLLGIVVGIFSIMSVMTAMEVLRTSIEGGMMQLGVNTFQVQKYPITMGGGHNRWRYRNRRDITYEQALRVHASLRDASAVGLEIVARFRTVFWEQEKTNPNVFVMGENVDGIATNDWTVETGRSFSRGELDRASRVAVLGDLVAKKLYPSSISPIGTRIRIDNAVFEVVGVFQPKGGAFGGDQGNIVVIPITAFFQTFGKSDRSINIMVKAASREAFDDCLEQTRGILRAARKVPPGADDDFAFFSNDSLIEEFNELTFYFRVGVLVVSSIALLAAGVGIMNIMLVSVTERTREIGIRKAIGARRKDIMSQFIIEAVILCQVGGVIGVLLGAGAGNIISLLMETQAVVPWLWAGIGFAACSLVGLVFGVYPAWKAAALDPIEALRYE